MTCVQCGTRLTGQRTRHCSTACENRSKDARVSDLVAMRKRYYQRADMIELLRLRRAYVSFPTQDLQLFSHHVGLTVQRLRNLLRRTKMTLEDLAVPPTDD